MQQSKNIQGHIESMLHSKYNYISSSYHFVDTSPKPYSRTALSITKGGSVTHHERFRCGLFLFVFGKAWLIKRVTIVHRTAGGGKRNGF